MMVVMFLGKQSREKDQKGVSLQHHCWTACYTAMFVRFYRNFFLLSFTFQTDFIYTTTINTTESSSRYLDQCEPFAIRPRPMRVEELPCRASQYHDQNPTNKSKVWLDQDQWECNTLVQTNCDNSQADKALFLWQVFHLRPIGSLQCGLAYIWNIKFGLILFALIKIIGTDKFVFKQFWKFIKFSYSREIPWKTLRLQPHWRSGHQHWSLHCGPGIQRSLDGQLQPGVLSNN